MLITPNQKQDKCPESLKVQNVKCQSDKDCEPNIPSQYGHGKL